MKRAVFAALAATIALLFAAPVSATTGTTNPCSHGNSGKDCRDDPNQNGKDCDPHGGGGVNEDHCKDTTTTTLIPTGALCGLNLKLPACPTTTTTTSTVTPGSTTVPPTTGTSPCVPPCVTTTTMTTLPADVLGARTERQLGQTGAPVAFLAALGLLLCLVGGLFLAGARREA